MKKSLYLLLSLVCCVCFVQAVQNTQKPKENGAKFKPITMQHVPQQNQRRELQAAVMLQSFAGANHAKREQNQGGNQKPADSEKEWTLSFFWMRLRAAVPQMFS